MRVFQLWMVQRVSYWWRKLCTWRQKKPFSVGQQFSSLINLSGGKDSFTWWWVQKFRQSTKNLVPNWKMWCKTRLYLFTEKYYRTGSARVSQSDIWITLQLFQVRILVDMKTNTSTHPGESGSAAVVGFFFCAVTRIQVAFCCSRRKEPLQTLKSPLYCRSWRRCCWWQQER